MTTLVGEPDLLYHDDDPRVVPPLPAQDHSGDPAVRIDTVTKVFTGRRGKVAAHLIWGGSSSVLVGDFLFARAFELMVEAGSIRALDILAKASSVIAEGEVLQLTRAHDLNLDQETYLEIISAKTAELFAASAEAGPAARRLDRDPVSPLAPSPTAGWRRPSSR